MATRKQSLLTITALASAVAAGCAGPLQRTEEQTLRESLIASHQRKLEAVAAGGVVELHRPPSDVEKQLTDERKAQLDQMSGMQAYLDMPLEVGSDLLGRDDSPIVQLSLKEAISLAMQHNLDVQFAQISPSVSASRVTQAEAAFDSTFFTTANWSKLDTPQPTGNVPGLAGDRRSENFDLATGIRKRLTTGGVVTLQTDVMREEQQPTVFGVNRFYQADVLASLEQPLLRGFGSDVNRADIQLTQSAREADVERLQQQLIDTAFNVEQAYWNLVAARQQLLIQLRLLARTIDDRDRLQQRAEFDVSPVRLTEANSFVELRRAEVIRARQQVRIASDALKRLINSPKLPIADETLVLPDDEPVDQPISFSLLDAVTTALQERPSLQVALLQIRDASIRQRVAANARLPLLNLTGTARINGLDIDSASDAYDRVSDVDYVDYILGAAFEVPIGNRGPEAFYRQRTFEREQSLISYRNAAQLTVLEVKNALREVLTSYELIGATRAARRSAADNLRALEEQEAAGVALTPEFLLDLKLNTQQRLADAETQEVQALTRYMTAIAQLYQVMGTLLDRNQINFVSPEMP